MRNFHTNMTAQHNSSFFILHLLVSYCLYRVQIRRLLSRIPAEEYTGDCTNCEGEEYTPCLDVDRPVGYVLYNE